MKKDEVNLKVDFENGKMSIYYFLNETLIPLVTYECISSEDEENAFINILETSNTAISMVSKVVNEAIDEEENEDFSFHDIGEGV